MSEKKRLSIRLLGPPKLLWNDKPLVIKRRMVRILIYYLAVKKRMVGRTEILLDFWPEDPNSRRNLRDLLSKLRSELPDQNIIKTDRDWVGLDFDSVYVDVLEFEDLFKQLTLPFLSVENRPLPEAIYQKMLHALHLWEGPDFMAGSAAMESEGLEDWMHEQSGILLGHRLDLTMRVCLHLINAGELENALDWLTKLILEDENYEYPQAVYLKIDVLYRLQHYVQAYNYGHEVMSEMGLDWFSGYSRPLKLLMEQIDTVRKRTTQVISEQTQAQNINRVPFAGQKETLFQIQKAYRRGGVLAITGESGIGKTRIIQEFLSDIDPSVRVFRMKATALHQKLSFQTIIEMLRKYLNETDWQVLEPFWGKQLITILPELKQIWSSQSALDHLSENYKINQLEAFNQLFLKLAKKQKMIIILDNAQWCDDETLSILTFLIQRNFFSINNFLILSMRFDEIHGSLSSLMKEHQWLEKFTTLEIPQLTDEDILTLSYSILGKTISKGLLENLKDASGGNALFIIETLRTLVEGAETSELTESQELPLSGTIHATILDRINRLSPNEIQALSFASVIRKKFYFHHLQKAMNIDGLLLADIFKNLILAGFLQVESPVYHPNVYKFTHQFIRQVCAMEITPAKYQLIHLRIARVLQSEYENAPNKEVFAQAAYHFAEAGEAITAFNLWIKVANYHSTFVEKPSSFEAYQNAQQIIFHQNFELTIQQVYDLFIGWGNLALLGNNLELANDCFTKATIDGQRRHDDFLVGCGYSGLAILFLFRGLPGPAMQYVNRAIELINQNNLEEYFRAHVRKAIIYIRQTLLPEAIEELLALQQFSDTISKSADKMALVVSKYYLALSYIFSGDYTLAYEQGMAAYKILRIEKNRVYQSAIELVLGFVEFRRGNLSTALKYFGDLLQSAELQLALSFTLQAIAFSSLTNIQLGSIYHGLEHISNGLKLCEVYDNWEVKSYLLNAQGKIYLDFNHYELALKFFKEALDNCDSKYQTIFQQQDIALTQCLMGDFDAGAYSFREVIQSAELYGLKTIEMEARIRFALMSYLNGNTEPNLTILKQLTPKATALEISGAGSALLYATALEAFKNNRANEMEAAVQKLEKLFMKEGKIWIEWHTLELKIKLAQLQNTDTQELEHLKTVCINKIKQSTPKNLLKEIQLNSAPIAILV